MGKLCVALALLSFAVVANAQPDDGPGMARPDPAAQGQGAPPMMVPVPPDPMDVLAKFNNPADKLDLSSPENTVRAFVWAFGKGDLKSLRSCVADALPYEKLHPLEVLLRSNARRMGFLVTDLHSYIEGDHATVALRLVGLPQAFGEGLGSSCERLHLKRVGDNWIIVTDGKTPDGKVTQFGFTPNTINEDFLAAQAATLANGEVLPILSAQAAQSVCQSNLKRISLGIMQFVQDFDEKYALHADWKNQIMPYVRSEEIFHCQNEKKNEISYSFNVDLENKMMAELNQPAQTIMIYEGADKNFEFRHVVGDRKFTNIAFADGHVKAFTQTEIEAALKNGEVRWKP